MAEVSDAVKMDKLKARASYVGAAVNVLQMLIKIGFGILGQSAALIADGIHSLSDLLSDLLVIIAVRLGSREADHDHPYGHRRFETIATVILGGSLIAVGGAIVWSVMERMADPEHLPVPNVLSMGVAALSILINEWLYQYTKRIAKTTRSKLLLANAWHQRSDAISSLVVLFGIGAVMMGYPLADGIAAVVVALMVAKIGLNLVFEKHQGTGRYLIAARVGRRDQISHSRHRRRRRHPFIAHPANGRECADRCAHRRRSPHYRFGRAYDRRHRQG